MVQVTTYDLRVPFDGGILSRDEAARVARFRLADAGRRWAAGRVGLRLILASELEADPSELVFQRGTHGKPGLAGTTLRFNKSDSRELAVVACCHNREIGVDVEAHRDVKRAERIANRFFSPAEQRGLAGLSGEARRRAFFDCWTVKEAVLKCDGGGLGAIPMASYSAPLDAAWAGAIDTRWWSCRFDLGAGLSAAVVLEGAAPDTVELTSARAGVGPPAPQRLGWGAQPPEASLTSRKGGASAGG